VEKNAEHLVANDNILQLWQIRNFKSVSEADIPLAPLTILVGENSSGKSTLIQSILFMAQNAQSPVYGYQSNRGKLDLNGNLVSLGTFDEAIYSEAEKKIISLGGTLKLPIYNLQEGDSIESRIENSLSNQKLKQIFKWSSMFEMDPEKSAVGIVESVTSEAHVFEGNLEISGVNCTKAEDAFKVYEDSKQPFRQSRYPKYNFERSAEISVGSSDKFLEIEQIYVEEAMTLGAVSYLVGLPINGLMESTRLEVFIKRHNALFTGKKVRYIIRQVLASQFASIRPFSAGIRGQLEIRKKFSSDFLSIDEAVEAYVEEAIRIIQGDGLDSTSLMDAELDKSLVPLVPLERIPFKVEVESTTGEMTSVMFTGKKLQRESLKKKPSELANDFMPQVLQFWNKVESTLRERIGLTEEANVPYLATPEQLAGYSERNTSEIENTAFVFSEGVLKFNEFLKRVVYLGPLREAPKDLYERDAAITSPQAPIGKRGELLARKIFENPVGNYPLPKGTSDDSPEGSTFKYAINCWLKAMGIAVTGVEVEQQGHFGYRLSVDGRSLRMLGTGISQVLPVIALCLLAPEGGLILLEEPELHLNPRIQQELAGFFLAMSTAGKQIIAETHSEYLITRLRLLAAKFPKTCDQFNFIFTSKNAEKGTVYEEVRSDDSGAMPEWPEGFFDQVSNDMVELLEISLAQDH
jgi:AAA15 family ATPase/GTPase